LCKLGHYGQRAARPPHLHGFRKREKIRVWPEAGVLVGRCHQMVVSSNGGEAQKLGTLRGLPVEGTIGDHRARTVIPAANTETSTRDKSGVDREVSRHTPFIRCWCFSYRCFVGTLLTRSGLRKSGRHEWADFFGMAAVCRMSWEAWRPSPASSDFLSNPSIRALPPAMVHIARNVRREGVALFNSFVHSRDAWTP